MISEIFGEGGFKYILTLILVFILPYNSFALSSSDKAHSYFLNANKLEKSLNIFDAKDALQKTIDLDPQNEFYKDHYAWFLLSYGFLEESAKMFQDLLSKKSNPFWSAGLGWAQLDLGDLASAKKNLQKKYYSPKLNGADYAKSFDIICDMSDQEDLSTIKEMQQKILQQPKNAQLYKELFNHYYYITDYKKAIAVVKTTPPLLHINEGLVYYRYLDSLLKVGDTKAALKEYQQLIRANPDNAYTYYLYGKAKVEMGDLIAGEKLLKKSLTLNPNAIVAQKLLLKTLVMEKKCIEARSKLEAYNKIGGLGYLVAAGDVNYCCKQYIKAVANYKSIIDKYPYNTDGLYGLLASSVKSHNLKNQHLAFANWEAFYMNDRTKRQNQTAYYYQPPILEASGEYYESSNGWQRKIFGSDFDIFAIDNMRIDFGYERANFKQPNFTPVDRNAFWFGNQILLTPSTTFKALLLNNKYISVINYHNNLNVNLELYQQFLNHLNISLGYRHTDLIDEQKPFGNQIYNGSSIGTLGLNIQGDDFDLGLSYDDEKFGLSGFVSYTALNDDNRVNLWGSEVSYRIFPCLKAAYNYYYLSFANPSSVFIQNGNSTAAYFDPLHFEAHTAKVIISDTLYNRWSWTIEGDGTYITKVHSFSKTLSGQLRYKFNSYFDAQIDARYTHASKEYIRDCSLAKNSFWAKNIVLLLHFHL